VSKAVFFDRDGTLLVEVGYLTHPSMVVPYHFAYDALRLARAHGYLTIVVTNQSGIARGYLTEEDLAAIHSRMQDLLRAKGVELDAIYYCPHYPEARVDAYRSECDCRKPATALGLKAIKRFDIDIEASFVIGDKETDVLFGKALGATPCLVRTGFGSYEEHRPGGGPLKGACVFDNVLEAVEWLVEGNGGAK
jgi:D-glycero-D-manno-heptose 1,7-bisphosphate phosphatase